MTVQIDKHRLDIERVRQEMRWETPRNIAIITGAAAALAAAIGGVFGFKLAERPIPPLVIINMPAPAK